MGKEAVRAVNRLGDIAAEGGRTPKGALERWAKQLLSGSMQRRNAEIPRQSELQISGKQGMRFDTSFAVPVCKCKCK